ncbi:NAD(P)-dependent oxidoreductase [Nocardiopsis trehalosi]|uniref:NAD(P)-dependent oxidoreductase n=1 Tax=Nocardiopsis trehalosi TaxID=109329 RepID=UPI00082D94C2|nr:NAD(P)H-binding protein [Nocardiopsis trehalosi]
MRITVFGATGRTGGLVVDRALESGHDVTAVVRDPARLRQADRPGLTTVTADALDPRAITEAVAGRDAVVSALGPNGRAATTVCADGAHAIATVMRTAGTRRLVVVTASGHVVDDGDGPFTRLVKPLLRRYLRAGFADFARAEAAVRASGLDWTLMRPPRLTGAGPRPYRTALDRNVRGGVTIGRTDLAHAVLAALADPATIGRSVAVGY